MKYTIIHPKEDMTYNVKENIFLVLDERSEVISHAYIYQSFNAFQTEQTPLLLCFYIETNNESIKNELYQKVYERALEIKKVYPNLTARFYTTCEIERDLKFFKDRHHDDASVYYMENKVEASFPGHISLNKVLIDVADEKVSQMYIETHNRLFVTPMNDEKLKELSNHQYFRMVYYYHNEDIIGSSTVYLKDQKGYIETIWVDTKYQGHGFSRQIMNDIDQYFANLKIYDLELEVWSINHKALKLYHSLGFKKTKTHYYTPSIILK